MRVRGGRSLGTQSFFPKAALAEPAEVLASFVMQYYSGEEVPPEVFVGANLFQQSFTPWRLLICSDLQFVPTHELAHAWEAANLTDDDFLFGEGLDQFVIALKGVIDRRFNGHTLMVREQVHGAPDTY